MGNFNGVVEQPLACAVRIDTRDPSVALPWPEGLREYQRKIVEKAEASHNMVVVLPTGSGKTLISFHIMYDTLRLCHDWALPGVAIFLTTTGILKNQQAKAFGKFKSTTGAQWLKSTIIHDNKQFTQIVRGGVDGVYFMTPQIYHDCMGQLSRPPCLVVFDEVHNARKDAPFNNVLERTSKYTRRIGLSATPFMKPEESDAFIETFGGGRPVDFFWLDRDVLTEGECPQCPYVRKRFVDDNGWLTPTDFDIMTESLSALQDRVNNTVGKERRSLEVTSNRMQLIGASSYDASTNFPLSIKEMSGIPERSPFLQELYKVIDESEIAQQSDSDAPKIKTRMLIIVGTVDLAHTLGAELEKRNLCVRVITGQDGDEYAKQMIGMLESGRIQYLVATPMVEEGVDIGECTHVIRFRRFANVIGYIQTRGRARKGALYLIMGKDDDERFKRLIAEEAQLESAYETLSIFKGHPGPAHHVMDASN